MSRRMRNTVISVAIGLVLAVVMAVTADMVEHATGVPTWSTVVAGLLALASVAVVELLPLPGRPVGYRGAHRGK